MTFEREERVAFARIISDLIEADFIVEKDEMKFFEEVKDTKDFRITIDMLFEAKTMSFAEAVCVLQKIKDKKKKKLIKDKLYEMSLSDGACVPLEALQIIAVKYALEGKGQVFSIPSGSSYVENMKVLYIENEDNTDADAYIRSHYRAISNEFRLAGFDFVYIPQIVEDYKQIRGEYLRKVITYIIPSLVKDNKAERIEKIQQDLCTMTTSRFSHELLYKKMGINMLSSKPAFLIKIGESSVADKSGVDNMERNMYSNFLLVPINKIGEDLEEDASKTILEHVVKLMDSYRSIVSGKLIIETRPMSKEFLYYGFHRSLFNLIAYGIDKTDYKLVINLNNKDYPVVLRPVDATPACVIKCEEDLPIDLTPQPYALYILMIYMSLLDKGLDWKDYTCNSPARLVILRKNNLIYTPLAKGNTNTEYRDKTHVSRIKAALKTYEKTATNIDLFIPVKIKDGENVYYNVPVPPHLVYVVEGPPGQEREVQMNDSELWRNLSNC